MDQCMDHVVSKHMYYVSYHYNIYGPGIDGGASH